MKLQFLYSLLVAGRGRYLRASRSATVGASPYAFPACDDAPFTRTRVTCRWQRNAETGRLEAHWATSG